MRFYWFALGVLGTWRVTHLLAAEDGPADLFVRLRRRCGDGFWGRLLDCFYCLSMWVATLFAMLLAESWKEAFLLFLALSGGAILLERVTSRDSAPPPAIYFEHGGTEDAVLRQSQDAVAADDRESVV